MIRYFFIISVFFYSTNVLAQFSWNTSKFPQSDTAIETILKRHATQLAGYEDKKVLVDVYEWRADYLAYLFETNGIFYEDALYKFVGSIFNHIQSNSPELQSLDLNYFITNSPIPNASSLGNGTFLINIGLLRKLQNESQLAYILSHEMAHFYLDHSNALVIERDKLTTSKEHKHQMDSILEQKYGRYEMMKSMVRREMQSEMLYSRKHEYEADSLGLLFLLNTHYDPTQAITCLNLLDTIDQYKFKTKINYHRALDFEHYPFRSRWLEEETTMFGNQIDDNYWERDSLKSHPDCKARATIIVGLLEKTQFSSSYKFLYDSTYFMTLTKQLDYEYIDSWIFYGDYGRAMFFTLKQLAAEPENKTLVLKLGQIFRLIYDAQLNHQFSQHVERPSLSNEEEYNKLLNILDKISLSELAQMGYHYHLAYLNKFNEHTSFLDNYHYFKNLAEH